jgi:hypothetical protein
MAAEPSNRGQTRAVPTFEPGIELNRGFYDDVVGPLLAPFRHSAALIGSGSQVLGYDTGRSTDHGWGPRITVFTERADVDRAQAVIDAGLPETYRDWPVVFGWDEVAPVHHVQVTTIASWFRGHLGFDPRQELHTVDWLVTPQQLLLEAIGGAVYHDGLGELAPARATLARMPDDVRAWMLACQWRRIDQDEPFAGRTAEVGDETGSRLLAARSVRCLMELHFLYERTYWPYRKWFGTAYARLPGSDELLPLFDRALHDETFAEREGAIVTATEALADMHNASGLPSVDDPTARRFHNRPFRVLEADRFVEACLGGVRDAWLRAQPRIGSIDQFVDSVDVLARPAVARRVRAIYA